MIRDQAEDIVKRITEHISNMTIAVIEDDEEKYEKYSSFLSHVISDILAKAISYENALYTIVSDMKSEKVKEYFSSLFSPITSDEVNEFEDMFRKD